MTSIIDRMRAQATARASSALTGAIAARVPGALGATLASAAGSALATGRAAAMSPDRLGAAAVNVAIGRVAASLPRQAADALAAARAAQQAQAAGGNGPAAALRRIPSLATPAAPAGPTAALSAWASAPLWGGLTLDRWQQLFVESANTPKAWKNLFHVKITELRPSPLFPAGLESMNLLAMDVGYSPDTMPGESIPLGSAVVDNLNSAERVELSMTTLDDSFGSIKRWFSAKAQQAAHADGTFGVPADFLVRVEITHMLPDGPKGSDPLVDRFLMRPSNLSIELSRRAPELAELQLSFVQFDTFMEP